MLPRPSAPLRILTLLTILLLPLFVFAADDLPAPVPVCTIATKHGDVIGFRLASAFPELEMQLAAREHKVVTFLGIPYAKPPIGELRWTYTKPPDSWKEPLQCWKFSPVCPQPTVPLYGDLGPASEDCLYLNVWTAAKVTDGKFADENRPVLFWIHGGGFAIGASSQKWYDGAKLADEGAIVVSCNYRLGPLGFLAHPSLLGGHSGNFGLRDMEQAIQWTADNIRNFGGDPNNITIWGESAGAAAVCALLKITVQGAYPYQKAIVMSTNTIAPQRLLNKPNGDLQSAEELGVEFQKRLGVADGPDVIKEMRAKSAADILKASRPGSAIPGVSTTDNLIVDGMILKEPIRPPPNYGYQGHESTFRLMIGNVADEGSMFADPKRSKIDTLAKYKEFLTQRFGAKADKALAIYPAATDAEVLPALKQLFDDIFIRSTRMHTRKIAPGLDRDGKPAYVYLFARKSKPMEASGWGVYHGSELPYFFGTVDDKEKYTDEDRELSRLIRTYVINFARTGNPNSAIAPQAPDWPPYAREEEPYIILDTPITTGQKLHAKTLDALIELEK